jgi:hypothetical protein
MENSDSESGFPPLSRPTEILASKIPIVPDWSFRPGAVLLNTNINNMAIAGSRANPLRIEHEAELGNAKKIFSNLEKDENFTDIIIKAFGLALSTGVKIPILIVKTDRTAVDISINHSLLLNQGSLNRPVKLRQYDFYLRPEDETKFREAFQAAEEMRETFVNNISTALALAGVGATVIRQLAGAAYDFFIRGLAPATQ